MDFLQLATAFTIFIAVALLVEGIYLLWQARFSARARRVARRLHALPAPAAASETSQGEAKALLAAPRLQHRTALASGLARVLAQSGSQITVGRFGMICAGIGAATLATALLAGFPAVICGALALGAGSLPLLRTLRRRAQRQAELERQLPEALDLISRSLRAGHALPSALKMAADEIAEPIGGEFRLLFNEINYGVPMADALKNFAARMPAGDATFFVVATLIQRETGGNLSELLDGSCRIIRERLKLLAQVKVFSAEGRLSAWILTILPFALGAVLYLVNPGFMTVLWVDPGGRTMLYGVAVMMAVGIAWMRSIIRIRV